MDVIFKHFQMGKPTSYGFNMNLFLSPLYSIIYCSSKILSPSTTRLLAHLILSQM